MPSPQKNIPPELVGTWRQLTGRFVDKETGEERPGLSQKPNGYFHFDANGRLFNVTTDSARKMPAGPNPTDEEAAALHRTIIAYTGQYWVEDDKLYFDIDVSWNESWNGTRQMRTVKIDGDTLYVMADIVNPMTGKPAIHRLTFAREKHSA